MSTHPRTDQARTERRESLLALLAHAEHRLLTDAEARSLRSSVEAELAEGDRARKAASGQQAAARRAQQLLSAAEQAIRETEAERDQLAEALATAARLAAALPGHLPAEGQHRTEAIRALCAQEISPQQALDDTHR